MPHVRNMPTAEAMAGAAAACKLATSETRALLRGGQGHHDLISAGQPEWGLCEAIAACMKRKVLFLCTGNSCRSQMAEAIVNARLQEQWRAFSAGTRPEGYVHPMALQALEEIGIRHDGRSKSMQEFQDAEFDAVVTLCDSALEECPAWLGKGKRLHRGFSDPFEAQGTEEEKMHAYRTVRDQIAREIPELLKHLKS